MGLGNGAHLEVDRIGAIKMSLAHSKDAADVLALRDAAAEWLVASGVQQWNPGELSVNDLLGRVEAGSLYVARHGGEMIATVTVTWAYEMVWGNTHDGAGYIHTIVIDRRYAGNKLGEAVLGWAEAHIESTGRNIARLDCAASNSTLRDYYRRRGYTDVGDHEFSELPYYPVTRFEKRLSDDDTTP